MIEEDLEPLITRCPNCATQFRVTENQLAAASGRVRCGACLTVFEGTEHLILDSDATFSDGREADAALDALLDELGNAEAADRSEPFESREQAQSGREDDFPAGAETADDVQLYGGFEDEATDHPETFPDESIAESDADKAGEIQADYEAWIRPGTPNIDRLVDEVVASGAAPTVARRTGPEETETPDSTAGVDAAPALEEGRNTGAELRLSALEKALADEGAGISPINFGPEPRRWWVPAVAAVLVVTLAAQFFYLQLPEWSRDPGMRGLYEGVCGLFGCELPEIRAVDAFRTRNLVVRSHPDLQNALVIDAVIVNSADFPQRFPDLELRFTSVGGTLVAGRTFSPGEYLAGEARAETLMPNRTPVQVTIELADPGEEAVNYTLSFH